MTTSPSENLLKALAVCAELTNTDLSPAAARILAEDLAEYPEEKVIAALERTRREALGRLTLAGIVARIEQPTHPAHRAFLPPPSQTPAQVEAARTAVKEIRERIASLGKKRIDKSWAPRLLACHAAGEPICRRAVEIATEVVAMSGSVAAATPDRVPGSDDE